jgi:hypothetical protein
MHSCAPSDAIASGHFPLAVMTTIGTDADLSRRRCSALKFQFLQANGVALERARAIHDVNPNCGKRANAVATSFTGLSKDDIEALECHAAWQIHACAAVYGDIVVLRAAAAASS